MKHALTFLLLLAVHACAGPEPIARIQAGTLEIGISEDGRLAPLTDVVTSRDYLPEGTHASMLTLRIRGEGEGVSP